jgi:capsular polysaccharide biosynthesis protein
VNEAENNHHTDAKIGALSTSDDVRERLWAYEDFPVLEEPPPFNIAGAFASLGFIGAAVRRNRRFWLAWALIGMFIGLGIYVKFPVAYQATVSILIKNNPQEDPVSAMETDQALATSYTVAANTVSALHLPQSVGSFQAAYTANTVTDQIMSLTVGAPTDTGAIQRANTLATQFLKFRASLLRAQLAQQVTALDQQVPAAQAHIASLQSQIAQLGGTASPQLTQLQAQLKVATDSEGVLESTVTGLKSSAQTTTASMIYSSQVLDAATLLKHSKVKSVIEYVLSGLIGGLAIGLGIVIVRELITDRLRRRDDIAAALGGPVRLSVGPVKAGRLSGGPRAAAARERDLRRIALHLRNAVPPKKQRGAAALAVVALDNAATIAPAVATMVETSAKQGMQVVVADLTKGAPVARFLGAEGVGVRPVRVGSSTVVAVIPDPDDIVPGGPLRQPGTALAGVPAVASVVSPPSDVLLTAYRSADLLLTIAELDPAFGADHLATWASDAVAVITAGHTRAGRAYAIGEMLKLSGVQVVSCVVIGADKTDESLGLPPEGAAAPLANGGVVPPGDGKPGAVLR